VRLGEVVDDELELAQVGDLPAVGEEALEAAPLGGVVEDRPVALHETLVTELPPADEVVQAVVVPAVVVAVALPGVRIREEQHDGRDPGRTDASLLSPAEAFVDLAPRDTAASLAVSAGANVKTVQRMLGHASAAMTLDIYAGLFDDDLDAVGERLSDAAGGEPCGLSADRRPGWRR
jgi:hypothetical protein